MSVQATAVYETVNKALAGGESAVLATVVDTQGSTPRKAGARMVVLADGTQEGTVGGGPVEETARRVALELLADADSTGRLLAVSSVAESPAEDDVICGGRLRLWLERLGPDTHRSLVRELVARSRRNETFLWVRSTATHPASALYDEAGRLIAAVGPAPAPDFRADALRDGEPMMVGDVFYDVHVPKPTLLVVGAGHVGQAVAHLAARVDFDVVVIDDREALASAERFPGASRRIVADMAAAVREFQMTPECYVVIATRNHLHDRQTLKESVGRGAAYVGMIGSRRKIKTIFDALAAEGVDRQAVAAVHAPIGLDIAAETVEEIAVSIVGELVAVRRGKKGKG